MLTYPSYSREVMRSLAGIYPQLYLTPGGECPAAYRRIVQYGECAPSCSPDHFHGSEDDRIELEHTPAGEVPVITLCDRRDFELFLQLMAHRAEAVSVPATQAAAIHCWRSPQ